MFSKNHFESARIGGFQLRFYDNGDGLKIYFGRTDKHGLEDCAEMRFKSDHYDLRFAENNDDVFVCPTTKEEFKGKGAVSAALVYANEMRKRSEKETNKAIAANTAKLVG